MDTNMAQSRGVLALSLFGLLGFAILMVTVPKIIPGTENPHVISAALERGYNAPVAFLVAVLWSVALLAGAALFLRRDPADPKLMPDVTCGRLVPWELIAVFALFFIAYCPWFVARYGPHMEDHGFIMSMFRMADGQLPFRDFEFLYGPSMVYSLKAWGDVFGVSMTSYFGYVALQEAVQFTLLMAVLQILIPDRRWRYLILLALLPFLVNTLLGVNWSAGRRLVAVLAILYVALRPLNIRSNFAVGAVIGVYATYSHEYAAAALFGAGMIYTVLLLGPDWRRALISGPVVLVTTLLVWAATLYGIMGPSYTDFFETMGRVVGVMSEGHVSFEFFWTLHSGASFALLALVCVVVGAGLARFRGGWASGDLFLVGALAYALLTLKSGLTRADHWHVGAAFLTLYFAALLPMPRVALRFNGAVRAMAVACVVVASASYVFGILPSARSYAGDYVRGARDVLTGVPTAQVANGTFRSYSTETSRSQADPVLSQMATYLAAPERVDRPVLYYGTAWIIAPRLGISAEDYKLDALFYSGFQLTEREYLEKNTDAYLLMSRSDYERVFGLEEADEGLDPDLPGFLELASLLATVHFKQADHEAYLLDRARDSVTAAYIRAHYAPVEWPEEFGFEILLERRAN